MSRKYRLKHALLRACAHFGENWNIGIIEHQESILTHGTLPEIRWLKHDYKGWFADPFILEETEETYTILVEAMADDTRKGVIARLTVRKEDFRLIDMQTILELDTHLSFPAILREADGTVKVYPENFQSGHSYMYEYLEGCALTVPELLCELALTDAVMFEMGDETYMTATTGDNASGSRLTILKKNTESGRFETFQEIELSDKTARGAGVFFRVGERLIRPAQICNSGYGQGLVFQEMQFDGEHFSIGEVNRILPSDETYKAGMHTYNTFGSVAAVDGYYYLPTIKRFPLRVMNKLLAVFGLSDGLEIK